MKFFLLGLIISTGVLAEKNDLTHRPRSFLVSGGKAVFVDFIEANYKISYHVKNRSAQVVATIKFNTPEAGRPIFDSVEDPSSITLNGEAVYANEIKTPSRETKVRVINKELSVGSHTAVISVPLKTLLDWRDGGVKSAFWISDLSERRFLERYLPANLEYDQVKMSFEVEFLGNKTKQKIYTNGVVEDKGNNTFNVSYPEYYNAASIFFHTMPEGTSDEMLFSLKSVDGREVPIVIYVAKPALKGTTSLETLRSLTTQIFHELEGDYGAWPHPSMVIYNAGQGGMEYHGATMTSASALGHELFHSYFARGMMPANGNSGWLDEALASWRDKGYQTLNELLGTSRMSNQAYYTRTTDYSAYTFGERFMSLMDGRFKAKGGLKPFMRHILEKRLFAPLFVEEFIKEMSDFYGESVEEDFRKYTFGTKNSFQKSLSEEHPVHQKMSIEELQKHL